MIFENTPSMMLIGIKKAIKSTELLRAKVQKQYLPATKKAIISKQVNTDMQSIKPGKNVLINLLKLKEPNKSIFAKVYIIQINFR